MVRQSGLVEILRVLVVFPCRLSVFLLKGHSLVVLLHLFHHLVSLLGSLIFEQSSHAKNGVGLSSISSILIFLRLGSSVVLTFLLVSPVLDVGSILHHSIVVHEIFSFKLTASRHMLWDSLTSSVLSLLYAFHF